MQLILDAFVEDKKETSIPYVENRSIKWNMTFFIVEDGPIMGLAD